MHMYLKVYLTLYFNITADTIASLEFCKKVQPFQYSQLFDTYQTISKNHFRIISL